MSAADYYYPPLPLYAAICLILATIFLLLVILEWRGRRRRGRLAATLVLGIVFAIATGQLVVGSYQQYVMMNTWTYTYRLEVLPNATASEALILPIPGDSSLLTGLHLVSGQANWSFTETPHGRGLYVRFVGAASIEAVYSEFPSSPSGHNSTLTMMNCSIKCPPLRVWIFYSGNGLAHLEFGAGGSAMPQSESVRPGWRLYQILPPPVA
jgi:hypothetical protein